MLNEICHLNRWQRDMCISQLESVWDEDTFKEYQAFINKIREARHKRIL